MFVSIQERNGMNTLVLLLHDNVELSFIVDCIFRSVQSYQNNTDTQRFTEKLHKSRILDVKSYFYFIMWLPIENFTVLMSKSAIFRMKYCLTKM